MIKECYKYTCDQCGKVEYVDFKKSDKFICEDNLCFCSKECCEKYKDEMFKNESSKLFTNRNETKVTYIFVAKKKIYPYKNNYDLYYDRGNVIASFNKNDYIKIMEKVKKTGYYIVRYIPFNSPVTVKFEDIAIIKRTDNINTTFEYESEK